MPCRLAEADDEENYLKPEWEINPHDIYFCSNGNGKLVRLGKGAFGVVSRLSSQKPDLA